MKIWDWVRRDGLLHIESCALITVVFGLFLPWWGACLVAFVAGIGKELWDTKHGVANWHDVICDIIGVVAGAVLVFL